MNFQSAMAPVTKVVSRALLHTQKNSPHILVGAGIVGMLTTVVLSSKASRHVDEIVDDIYEYKTNAKERYEKDDSENAKKEYAKELIHIYTRGGAKIFRLYGPAITVGTISIACILKSHGIMIQRNAALVAAYNTLDNAYSKYRNETKLTLGEEKEREVFERANQDIPDKTYSDDGQVVDVASPYEDVSTYAKWFDETSPYWQRDGEANRTFLLIRQRYLNDLLRSRGHVFLNEVYEELGLPHTRAGSIVGWISEGKDAGDGYIDFGIMDSDRENARDFINGWEKSVLLDFNVDGAIWNLI